MCPTHTLSSHRHYVQTAAEDEKSEVELFLNSVPLLASLHREEKLRLVGAFLEEVFPGECLVGNVKQLCSLVLWSLVP